MNNCGPKHLRAKWFLTQFQLSTLTSFSEFESRVAALPDKHARGYAFEVFAEAWLASERIPQARNVWPGNTSPISLQEKLKLPLKDMGVDGIFESTVEETTCYQVKFRTGRPRLSWDELSTFFGLADAECGRLVFTNCDEISQVAQDRRQVVFVRGGDPISTRWETMFSQLVEYKKRFGHTNVQSNSKEHEKLGNWVKMQRRDKHIGRAISHERAKRLEALGFTWRFVEPLSWERMFELLVDYKKRNGHCNVPQRFIENIKFGRWVNTQRIHFKHGRLSPEKQQRLNDLGFSWNTKINTPK